jgi:hypothetical protein
MQVVTVKRRGWLRAAIALLSIAACERGPKDRADPHLALNRPAENRSAENRLAAPRASGPGVNTEGKVTKLGTLAAGEELGDVATSRDGRHFAYVVKKDGREIVSLDGKASRPYEAVRSLTFDEDGNFAFVASGGGSESVVVNGKEGARYGRVGTLRFGAGGRVLYSATRGEKWFVVYGARERGTCSAADPTPVTMVGGSRVILLEQCARTNLRSCTADLQSCVKGTEYPSGGQLRGEPSGKVVAFIAQDESRQAVVTASLGSGGLLERVGGWYEKVDFLSLSDGGEHVAFFAHRAGQVLMVMDGKERPFSETESPLDFAVSRSGRVMWSTIDREKVSVFVDGRRMGGEYGGVEYLTFSPDGSRACFVATRDDRSALVVDGREGPFFDKVVTPKFVPNGDRIVYRARDGGERFVVVSDAEARLLREFPHFEAVFDVAIAGDSTVYVVRKGDALFGRNERL